jgi:hypothetical protein
MKLKSGDVCLIIGAQYNHQFVGKSVTLRDYYVSETLQGFEGWHVDGLPPAKNGLNWVVDEKYLMKISGDEPESRLSLIAKKIESCFN